MTDEIGYRSSSIGLFEREEGTEGVKKIFFLSVEGTKTEPSYFKWFNAMLRGNRRNGVILHVIKRPNDGRVSPEHVLWMAEECKAIREAEVLIPMDDVTKETSGLKFGINISYREYLKSMNSDDEDRFLIVIDRDTGTHTKEGLLDILERCQKKDILCCLSNPSFDFWLLLHLVQAEKLKNPDEYAKILKNERISKVHSYVSKWVSDIAGHAKKISRPKFNQYYAPKLKYAINQAEFFATENQEILDKVGSSIPKFINEIFET